MSTIDPTSQELSDLLSSWDEAKKQLDHWKTRENMLRLQIFGGLFDDPVPGKGNKVRLPYDMALVADYRINYTIDQAAMDASRSVINPDGSRLIEPAVFDSVISFRPSVKDAAFRDLDDDTRRPFTVFITAAPGTPGIEIKPANKVRW